MSVESVGVVWPAWVHLLSVDTPPPPPHLPVLATRPLPANTTRSLTLLQRRTSSPTNYKLISGMFVGIDSNKISSHHQQPLSPVLRGGCSPPDHPVIRISLWYHRYQVEWPWYHYDITDTKFSDPDIIMISQISVRVTRISSWYHRYLWGSAPFFSKQIKTTKCGKFCCCWKLFSQKWTGRKRFLSSFLFDIIYNIISSSTVLENNQSTRIYFSRRKRWI